jgi:hypothetical protein
LNTEKGFNIKKIEEPIGRDLKLRWEEMNVDIAMDKKEQKKNIQPS